MNYLGTHNDFVLKVQLEIHTPNRPFIWDIFEKSLHHMSIVHGPMDHTIINIHRCLINQKAKLPFEDRSESGVLLVKNVNLQL